MAESTCVPVEEEAALDTRARRAAAERGRRREMRRDVTWGIEEKGLGAVMRLVNFDSSPRFGGPGVAAAHITCQTALVLGGMWHERRDMRPSEATTFRVLGDLASRARLGEDDAVASVEAGWNELLGVVRRDARGGPWSDRTRDAVLTELETEAQAFTAAAAKELRLGMAGDLHHGEDRAGVLLRLLDGRLVGEDLGAAATAAGLDVSREHGLVLLVDQKSRTRVLDEAAQEVEATIPNTVDLGLGDNLPVSRRLVFPVLTHGRWIEARTNLHEIATKHGVLAVAPAVAPTLAKLGPLYRETERNLGSTLGGCGFNSGIVDPACVEAREDNGERVRELLAAAAASEQMALPGAA